MSLSPYPSLRQRTVPCLSTYSYEVVEKEFPEDNEKGYKDGDVITSPYTGYKSEGWAVKYDKVTGKEIERVKVSTDIYDSRDKVIAKIIKAEEPTEPTDPTEPTEPVDPTEPTPTEPTPTEPDPTDPTPTEPSGEGSENTDSQSTSKPIELPMISG